MRGISRTRASTVQQIPLEEAVSTLRSAANRVEIRHSNLVLRVLAELEARDVPQEGPWAPSAPEDASSSGLPAVVSLVRPVGHHGNYRRHVADDREGGVVTCCGVPCTTWREEGRVRLSTAASDGSLCGRCRRTAQLAIEDDPS